MVKQLSNQLALDLFAEPRRSPTWEDAHKGRAKLVDRVEPCDRCAEFFRNGKCTHTAENYAFPKQRPNGMCVNHYLVWCD